MSTDAIITLVVAALIVAAAALGIALYRRYRRHGVDLADDAVGPESA